MDYKYKIIENGNVMKKDWGKWLARIAMATLMLMSTIGAAWAADYRPLVGRWQRTDGGYVIEIRQVATDGAMEAGYFNPRPINVSRANASIFKEHIKVDVELRDAGYPGSTYTLLYDPDKDALLGFYYQAVQKQNFDVVFVRMK
jgi:hypothetical protein